MSIGQTTIINIVEWTGVASSLTGSVLNAHGKRSAFIFWTMSAVLLGAVAFVLGRSGLMMLQVAGIGINMFGMRNWQGNAPTRSFIDGDWRTP